MRLCGWCRIRGLKRRPAVMKVKLHYVWFLCDDCRTLEMFQDGKRLRWYGNEG